MISRRCFLLLVLLPALLAAKPEQVVLSGTLTNTHAGDVSAPARLELSIDGEKVHARLTTEEPLTGTGEMTGRILGGWLELSGKLGEGPMMKFRGALSPVDYRGTYFAVNEGELVQYGRFELARATATKSSETVPSSPLSPPSPPPTATPTVPPSRSR